MTSEPGCTSMWYVLTNMSCTPAAAGARWSTCLPRVKKRTSWAFAQRGNPRDALPLGVLNRAVHVLERGVRPDGHEAGRVDDAVRGVDPADLWCHGTRCGTVQAAHGAQQRAVCVSVHAHVNTAAGLSRSSAATGAGSRNGRSRVVARLGRWSATAVPRCCRRGSGAGAVHTWRQCWRQAALDPNA